MKRVIVFFLIAVISVMVFGCNGSKENNEIVVGDIKEGYLRLDITSKGGKTEGFGTQFDTCIVEKQNGLTEEEWKIQTDALKLMNLQSVRIRFYPEMYERANDNTDPNNFDYNAPGVDFNSAEMRYLYKLLDVFEENNVKVDLSWYGCRTTFVSEDGLYNGSWLGGRYGENGVTTWMAPPTLTDKPNEEFAESVAACLNYLIKIKGYTCIYEYSLFPEPEGVIKNFNSYKAIVESVQNRLKALGLSDKVIFSGPADYNNDPKVFKEKYLSNVKYGKATSSVYCFNAQSTNEAMYNFAENYSNVAKQYGITWGIAESGTSNFINPVKNSDTDTYDRALFMARFLINLVNGGCTNIKYFVFSDCYYDGTLNELGLFKFRHENFAAKPVWYSWSLITKYTDFGSDIYPITSKDENLCATAFKLPDGSWTYMLANNSSGNIKAAIINGRADRPGKMYIYKMMGSLLPTDKSLTLIEASAETDASQGVVYVSVPANGFLVISDKGIN